MTISDLTSQESRQIAQSPGDTQPREHAQHYAPPSSLFLYILCPLLTRSVQQDTSIHLCSWPPSSFSLFFPFSFSVAKSTADLVLSVPVAPSPERWVVLCYLAAFLLLFRFVLPLAQTASLLPPHCIHYPFYLHPRLYFFLHQLSTDHWCQLFVPSLFVQVTNIRMHKNYQNSSGHV